MSTMLFSGNYGEKVPFSRLVAYGLLMLPLATAGLPLAIYIAPFYTDKVGLSFAMVGLVLMLTRAVDIIIDPLIGRLSDSTSSRFGRRRPWMLAGLPLMLVSTWFVFDPPQGTTALSFFFWLALFYASWTMITVPYLAWGAELSDNYDERSRISGAREIFGAIGLLVAFTAPTLLVGGDPVGDTKIAQEMNKVATETISLGYITIALLPITFLALFLTVREPRDEGRPGARNDWRSILSSRPFKLLIIGQLLSGLAFGINQTTAVYYFRYRIGLEKDQADLVFVMYFVFALLGAWAWIWLGRKLGKRTAMALATFLNGIFIGATPFIAPGDFWGFLVLQICGGLVYEGPLILGASMLADVIELDVLKTRIQRSAAFVAIWGIGRKFTEAAGAGIALPALEAMGFNNATAMSPTGQSALILVNATIPAVLAMCAAVPIMLYPIDARTQRRIRAAIDRRKHAGNGNGPAGEGDVIMATMTTFAQTKS
jgi:glycoside/pentoside/hexuronide:cation symporter, GPH family